MTFIYSRITAGPDQTVIVYLDHQANVFVTTDEEFEEYRLGHVFRCRGGWADHSPIRITPPAPGTWCVIIDLAGQDLPIRTYIELLDTREAYTGTWDESVRAIPPHPQFRRPPDDYVGLAVLPPRESGREPFPEPVVIDDGERAGGDGEGGGEDEGEGPRDAHAHAVGETDEEFAGAAPDAGAAETEQPADAREESEDGQDGQDGEDGAGGDDGEAGKGVEDGDAENDDGANAGSTGEAEADDGDRPKRRRKTFSRHPLRF